MRPGPPSSHPPGGGLVRREQPIDLLDQPLGPNAGNQAAHDERAVPVDRVPQALGVPQGDVERDIARQHRLYLPMEIDDVLLTHSTLWRWARSQLRGNVSDEPPRVMPADPPADSGSPPGPPPVEPPPPSPLARVPPERFTRNLLQMVALVRAHAAHAVLLSFSQDALQTRDPYAVAIGEVSRERQLPLLVYAGPRLDIVHPTAEGYAWLADQLLARLTAEGWVGR